MLTVACAAGDGETVRQANTLATAISWPRQYSAAGFARAALATNLGCSPAFSVLEITELTPAALADPLGRLVIRIHRDAVDSGWSHEDALDACYRMDFNYYGIIDEPERVDCPEGAQPIQPPPAPRWDDAPGYDEALREALEALPGKPSESDVADTLRRAYLVLPLADPEAGPEPDEPVADVLVRDLDVGLAIRTPTVCVLGNRRAGVVTVWRPTPQGCSAVAALRG